MPSGVKQHLILTEIQPLRVLRLLEPALLGGRVVRFVLSKTLRVQDLLVLLVLQALRVLPVLPVLPARRVMRVMRAQPVPLGLTERAGRVVDKCLVRVKAVLRVLPVLRVLRVVRVMRVMRAELVELVERVEMVEWAELVELVVRHLPLTLIAVS